MIIELNVSEQHEGNNAPWWMIIDPKQMLKPDPAQVAMSMITGPFFSRESAEGELNSRRYAYSKRAVVWCAAGCYGSQYDQAFKGGKQ